MLRHILLLLLPLLLLAGAGNAPAQSDASPAAGSLSVEGNRTGDSLDDNVRPGCMAFREGSTAQARLAFGNGGSSGNDEGCGDGRPTTNAAFKANSVTVTQPYADNSAVIGIGVPNEPPTYGKPTQSSGARTFSVTNGQIIGPDGKPFIVRGINILDDNIAKTSATLIQSLFPKLNFVRLAVGGDDCGYRCAKSNAAIEAWVQSLTDRHIVVMIESHFTGQPSASTVKAADEAAWYSTLASFFKSNPYVWFASGNELAKPGVSAEHTNVYNAVRKAGSNTIVVMCVTDGAFLPDNAAAYTGMTNIVWDEHFYNWITKGSNKATVVDAAVRDVITNIQAFTHSADGTIPVIFGEIGYNDYVCTSNGATGGICGAMESATGAMRVSTASASGFAMWLWTFTPCCARQTDHVDRYTNRLTAFGQNAAPFIAAGPGPVSGSAGLAPVNRGKAGDADVGAGAPTTKPRATQ
jgi:Cellulase (glycosyl hydrolase family 5)